jgi:biopolymer transport protein ExbD
MSMSAGGGGGLNAEPNVTPMIDVLMVLLIIFMVIVPSSRKAIDVQLPDPNPSQAPSTPNNDQIVLTVHKDGGFEINKEPQTLPTLPGRLKGIYDGRPDKIIFIKGDPDATYQDIIQAMDIARGAGVKVIGFTPKAAAGA